MRRLYWVPLALALLGGRVEAQDGKKGEIRVYLADNDKNPVDLSGIRVILIVQPEGGKKRVMRTKVVTPEGLGRL